MIMPLGTYITPKRLIGLPAVFCSADSAGIMLSSSGSASIEPMPRKTVRRGIDLLVMNIINQPFLLHRPESCLLNLVHLASAVVFGSPAATAMLNGVLVTIALMIEDQEYSPAAASRAIRRTAGMS